MRLFLVKLFFIVFAVFIFMTLLIILVEYDKATKWNRIYKKRGRDDD